MPTRTCELTIVVLWSAQTEEYDADADLESIGPKGTEDGKNVCDYCEGDEEAPAKGALCDAHAAEESINSAGLLYWLEVELGGATGKGAHWQALKEAKVDKRITLVGRLCWYAGCAPDWEVDEEFEIKSVTIEDAP